MLKVRVVTAGSIAAYAAAIFTIISFSTPYWLVSDNLLPDKKFDRLGLWEACFARFEDINYRYDRVFKGCKWIFDEDYQIMRDILEPPFFVATQVFFTIGFVLLLLACILLLAIQLCCTIDKEVVAFRALAALLIISAICCTIAVIVFGAHGDGRDWMPDPDHNYLSWSFALGVVGAFFEYVAAVLFWIESRLILKRSDQGQQQVFSLDQRTAQTKA